MSKLANEKRARSLQNPDLLKYPEAAAFLSVSTRHLWDLVDQRKVPVVDLGFRTKRFRRSDLEKVLAARTKKAVGIV